MVFPRIFHCNKDAVYKIKNKSYVELFKQNNLKLQKIHIPKTKFL